MSLTNKIKITATAALFGVAALVGCQKMERPALGNYVKDTNPPGGPLKLYTSFPYGIWYLLGCRLFFLL